MAKEEADETDDAWSDSEPESMNAIARALELESVAPQWRVPTDAEVAAMPQELQRLSEEELAQLAGMDEQPFGLSGLEQELLGRSVASLDYLGNWADTNEPPTDSIVQCCMAPEVHDGEGGPEYTCMYDDFTAERGMLHTHIVERMLTSTRTRGGASAIAGPKGEILRKVSPSAETIRVHAAAAAAAGSPPAMAREPPGLDEQHVFFVVGVPGSGKDTVLKRYLRSLGLPLLDASADLVKEYLAAFGQDELSRLVRDNNVDRGPGKHLLHAQYLHRESILITDRIVDQALDQGTSLLLEKTLFNLDGVLGYAKEFRDRGCRCHLLGTHIQPLRNWKFLETRMSSGQAFGRYITKEQVREAPAPDCPHATCSAVRLLC